MTDRGEAAYEEIITTQSAENNERSSEHASKSEKQENVSESLVISGETLLTGATEEVSHNCLDPSADDDFEYDPISIDEQHPALYELYQPKEMKDGRLACRICVESSSSPLFDTRAQFAQHRYKEHGTFLHALPCPASRCRQTFPSLPSLKRHLLADHSVPIETHYKHFSTFADFERWRNIVECASRSRFLLHNKQPHLRRQVMHCSSSQHVAFTSIKKARQRTGRMTKEGACCPAHISYLVEHDGSVDAFYQMVHYGHAEPSSEMSAEDPNGRQPLPQDFPLFPSRQQLPRGCAMRYVQLSLMNMVESCSVSSYSRLLVVSCLQSSFLFCRPLPSFDSARSFLVRNLVDIFAHFGTPVGFSAPSHSAELFDAMEIVESVFSVNFLHIGYEMKDYASLRRSIFDRAQEELKTKNRWPEVLPFVVFSHNTRDKSSPHYLSPFEAVFGRLPCSVENPALHDECDPNSTFNIYRFRTGDHVLVRALDCAEGVWRGEVVGVDWERSPHFPFRVSVSATDDAPCSDSPSFWMSPSDLAPFYGDHSTLREQRRQELLVDLMCRCNAREDNLCDLFRAALCQNQMSRVCCERSSLPCSFHHEYSQGAGDTYKRLETLCRRLCEKTEEEGGKGTRLRRAKTGWGAIALARNRSRSSIMDQRIGEEHGESVKRMEVGREGEQGAAAVKAELVVEDEDSDSEGMEGETALSLLPSQPSSFLLSSAPSQAPTRILPAPAAKRRRVGQMLEEAIIVDNQEFRVQRLDMDVGLVEAAPRRGILIRKGRAAVKRAAEGSEEPSRRKSERHSKPNRLFQEEFYRLQ